MSRSVDEYVGQTFMLKELPSGQICETPVSTTMEESMKSEVMTSSSMNAHASASSSSSCSQHLMVVSESIEESKKHWSELSNAESSLSDIHQPHSVRGISRFFKFNKVIGGALSIVEKNIADYRIAAENRKVYKSLQLHREWDILFRTFNKEPGWSLVVEDKFAEGAQAEIFNVSIQGPNMTSGDMREKKALKVFKKGTLLQDLQKQWPHGYLQRRAWSTETGFPDISYVSCVEQGVLLPSGQFGFLMSKEDEDLRKLINRSKPYCGYASGPFEKEILECFLYQIACGMDWLHKRDIVHRDLKASNVLVSSNYCCVADFECSIGVIGTGFWRDPQILQACRERNASERPELFTRAADVYSYAMTCYEILTGKLPFEGEVVTIDLVIEGQRPKVPECVDDWIKDLICKCWETNRDTRPTFEEILNIIVANTTSSWIKSRREWHMKINAEAIKPLLGCNNSSHCLERMESSPYESGVYKCKLCLEKGWGGVYHCSGCGDFDLHPKCATIPLGIISFLHPHVLILHPNFTENGRGIICDACRFRIHEGRYYNSYKCTEDGCDFALHIHCAKYARAISHHLHEEHELVLMSSSAFVEGVEGGESCCDCNFQLDPSEIVYSCIECRFNIHPRCIIGELECKSW